MLVYHDLVRFLIVGVASGWIAAILVRGRIFPRGCFTYVLLGITGALIGGFIFRAFGFPAVARVLAAALASVVGLLIGRLMRRNL